MKKIRIIPRLDVKGENVVKGIHLEGLRVVGSPAELAQKYYAQGADELIYMDIVASLYNRNNLSHIVEETTKKGVFIPITVGGGIRTLEDIENLLRSGADKVAINTAAIKNPELLKEAVQVYGSSTIVLSVEAKKVAEGKWEAYTDNGREKSGRDVVEWIKEAEKLGVGEILLTSVDQEGTKRGFDLDLIQEVTDMISVPLIVSGGAGEMEHLRPCLINQRIDGIALANVLHYGTLTVDGIKDKFSREYPNRVQRVSHELEEEHNNAQVHVSILDCQLGNLESVKNTLNQLGAKYKFITTPEEIAQAQFLILPGVGAFAEGMRHIQKQGLIEPIKRYASSGRPLLGICLGMQLMMTQSQEFGAHQGLNLIEGEVIAFPKDEERRLKGYKVPHVGWNAVNELKSWDKTILDGLPSGASGYFVHSYFVQPKYQENTLATTKYFDYEFCSVVQKDNIYGCQFHPEKSGPAGLMILNNFLNLSAEVGVS